MSGYATLAPVDETLDLGEAVLARTGDEVTLVGGSGARLWRLLDGTRTVTEVAMTVPEPNAEVGERPGDFVLEMVMRGAVRLTEEPVQPTERISSEVVWVEDDGQVHLLDVGAGTLLALDPAESALWRLLDTPRDARDMTAALALEGHTLDHEASRRRWVGAGLLVPSC